MSTSSLNFNTGGTSGFLGTSGQATQIVGLASGLDTSAIISQLMSIASFPEQELTVQQSGVQAKQNTLSSLQGLLQNLSADAANLSSPTLFDTSQSVTSSDPARVAATTSTGAGVGGYQVQVTQLANSAQRTYAFASPSSADAITIDGHATTIPAGSTIQQFVASINSDSQATVYAAAVGGSTVVLSSRASGNTGTGFIALSDPGGTLTEQTTLAKQGQDAQFTVDGVAGSSSSNTVTNAIAGVTLTLGGVTTTTGPVTVNVTPPAPSATTISGAINQFVSDYNAAVTAIHTQLTTTPVSNPTNSTAAGTGTLYNDHELSGLLTSMRQMMYTSLNGLTGLTNLGSIGITTGSPSGNAAPASSSIAGLLTVDTTALTNALQSNPTGVKSLLAGFSTSFKALVDNESGPGGVMSQRISAEAAQSSQMGHQILVMQAGLATQQKQLQAEFANLEAALSLSQSQESTLTNQIAQLP